ncbi:hypothetical protein C900_05448 [Fulvivirga imtechensis AK7]|uniref:Uncharacterized protein n=1 Tax=Fulvivirga imtechensis AK7 TaxID=1237149 RepID=L8JNE8_9BACT|nr:hypothetical protein C900_05448 [Fulvivirga imtechensis AK7]
MDKKGYLEEFSAYCNHEFSAEIMAVRASFFGDHENTLKYAVQDARDNSSDIAVIDGDYEAMKLRVEKALTDSTVSEDAKARMREFLALIEYQTDRPDYFKRVQPHNATDFIVSRADHFQFTLINEAHYSSQNRAFTRTLLQPLWDKGYRYLALETLSYDDPDINDRGYAERNSGFYTADPVFAEMVAEALKIGYKLVTYETRSQSIADGTERDFDQAMNIFNQTIKIDSNAKVLIHAGYGHILEVGDDGYQPMGAQLKRLLNKDVLTIDQERMVYLPDSTKMNALYMEAHKNFSITEPSVFLDGKNKPFVEPFVQESIDIQVFHPKTEFKFNRPTWLKSDESNYYLIPDDYLEYEGSLIQAIDMDRSESAIPNDQTIIKKNTALVLPPGKYKIHIVDRNGNLIGRATLEAN